MHSVPGVHVDDAGVVQFGKVTEGPPVQPKGLHDSEDGPRKDGGTLSFVTGDLMDAAICPGPFDAIIERRTVQLFPLEEQVPALERLSARLSDRGVFVSHQHNGGWRRDQPRNHYAEPWLVANGFVLCPRRNRGIWDAPARLARLMYSTG
jgi:hypothetical protein